MVWYGLEKVSNGMVMLWKVMVWYGHSETLIGSSCASIGNCPVQSLAGRLISCDEGLPKVSRSRSQHTKYLHSLARPSHAVHCSSRWNGTLFFFDQIARSDQTLRA